MFLVDMVTGQVFVNLPYPCVAGGPYGCGKSSCRIVAVP